ncbi:MAG: hypothetical protein JXA49_08575 [Actinobacteria bacterium]|nr:hypothetical protein [Actinomycetota bacterium]
MQWIKATICKTCGVPAIWTSWVSVDSDNTSIDSKAGMRGVFFEIDEVQNVFSKIEEKLAIPFSRVYLEAHKEVIRQFFEGALVGKMGTLVRKSFPGQILGRLSEVAPLFGVGTVKVTAFRRGESMTVESRNVWNDILINSDVGAAFEAITQQECDVEGQWEGDRFVQKARRRTEAIEEFKGRFVVEKSKSIGTCDIPKCYHCGAPITFQVFEWNREKGEIIERDTGLRIVYETPASVNSLVFEMEKEVGGEIHNLVIRIEADYVKEKILSGAYEKLSEGKDAKDTIFEYMNLIRRRCFGNPIISDLDGNDLRVTIRNPGSEDLVIGRILGSYEAVTGEKGMVHVKHDEEGLKVAVKPEQR